ncbi:hypothetical protein ABTM93_19120, partial [Acinetobacter baumannii]
FISSFLLLLLFQTKLAAQCPSNIGFETGDFTNWVCYAGGINAQGVISVQPTSPIYGRHTMLKNTFPQQIDQYGKFPVNCPNGSDYSIKLGNEQTG